MVICNTTNKSKSITSQSFILRIFTGFYNSVRILLDLRRFIIDENPQLIHLASSSSFALFKDLLIIIIAKYYKIPVVTHWHFGRIPAIAIAQKWEWKFLKGVIKKSTLSIVIDSKSHYSLQKKGFSNVVNIPNPLGLETEQKCKLKIKSNDRHQGCLIFVGHIVRSKGVYELVEACAELIEVKKLSLIGPYEENVKKELMALSFGRENGEWLSFLGEINKIQVLEQISESFLLVLPSYTEGFPNAVLEGMAMGCAVVATDVGAIPEMLNIESDKPCGICVPPKNIRKLKDAISELLNNPQKAVFMGQNGIERVLNNYSIEKIAPEYLKVWDKAKKFKEKNFNNIIQAERSTKNQVNQVLLVSPVPPPVGGIASWTLNMVNYFSNGNSSIKLALLNSAIKNNKNTSNFLLRRFFIGIKSFISINFAFRKLIKSNKPCIIHLVSSSSLALFKDFLLINYARKFQIPVIMHWRFGRIPALSVQRNWEWKLLCLVIRRSNLSIVIDSGSYHVLLNAGIKNVINIPNPVGLDIEKRTRILINGNSKRNQNHLIFVGHIVKNKGVYELAKACSQIPLVKELLFIGPCRNYVKKKLLKIASTREKGTWLHIIGELKKDQVLEKMHSSQILVLPSYTEGFPNAVLEGMAMGCAIIASDVGAISEMLDIQGNKPCGICVPPHNYELLREAILELLQNPDKTEIMGKNGINRVLSNYTIDSIVNEYITAWENVKCGEMSNI